MSKLILLKGNSGKTTASYFLSSALAVNDKKGLIIATDHNNPIYQILVDRSKDSEKKSLGKILSSPIVDIKVALDNMIPFKHNKNLGFISYAIGENEKTYPQIIESDISVLIESLKSVVDYIVVDCSTYENSIDKFLLHHADVIFNLTSADLKGVAYRQKSFAYEAINVLVNSDKNNPLDDVLKTFERQVKYILPYCTEVTNTFNGSRIEEVIPGKKYNAAIQKMIKEVIIIESDC